jgi:cob(I)alamin adenosyltransferase
MMHKPAASVEQRRHELQAKIAEVEETLHQLQSQLKAEEASAQHAAIDRLDDYLELIDNKYANLRAFWQVIREEWSALVDGKGKPKEGS